jgi:hypothetical protein
MKKIINNIKKYFVYIVGTLFFIIAIFIMLIPQNCMLMGGKYNTSETFVDVDVDINSGTSSIQKYKCMVGNNISEANSNKDMPFDYDRVLSQYDSELITTKNFMEDSQQFNKLLILSRCYQMPNTGTANFNATITLANLQSYSYTENIKEVTNEFKTILDKINNNIEAFKEKCSDGQTSAKIIQGAVYVIIIQYPLFKDISSINPGGNNVGSLLNVSSSMIPQTINSEANKNTTCGSVIYYSPSYIAEIAKNITKTFNVTIGDRSTPISYDVYIIYDLYKNGPGKPDNLNPFSKSLKKKLDANSLSSAEQCFLSAMGGSGYSYIGGCASYQGPINNTSPANNSFCTSPIQGDNQPWSYFVLYTVNSPYVQYIVEQKD